MEKYNFRFVDDSENPNRGLTDTEIDFLQEKLNLKFPQLYVYYLQNAGKNSNVFQVETNAEELENLQKKFSIETDKLNLLKNQSVLCVKKEDEKFFFFNLSETESDLNFYVFKEICINEGWNAYQKIIERVKEDKFVLFINAKTDEKYGLSAKQHLKNIPLYIISIPISLIIIATAGSKMLIEYFKQRIK